MCAAWGADAKTSGGAWGHVPAPMTARLSPMGRSFQDDLSDTSRNVIGAIFAAE